MVSGPKASLAISPKQYLFRAFLQPMYRSPLRRRSWSFDDLLGLVIGHTQLVQKLSVSFSSAPIRLHNYWDRTGFRSLTYSDQANGLLSVNLDDLSVIRSHGGSNRPAFAAVPRMVSQVLMAAAKVKIDRNPVPHGQILVQWFSRTKPAFRGRDFLTSHV